MHEASQKQQQEKCTKAVQKLTAWGAWHCALESSQQEACTWVLTDHSVLLLDGIQ
jgi:hypothetical protein